MPKATARNVRVPDDLWGAAQVVAAARGESVSDVVRAALRRYVARSKSIHDSGEPPPVTVMDG